MNKKSKFEFEKFISIIEDGDHDHV